MTLPGFERAMVVGHDRGARVGHRWALDRPDQVERLAVLDIVPTREMFRRLDASLASGYWHWLFHMRPDLPERLVGPDIRGYLEYFFERWTYNRHGLTADAVGGYVRSFSRPGALRASLDDYRAIEEDIALDDIDAAEGHRLTMPVLALWGSVGCRPACPRWTSGASTRMTSPVPRSRSAATSSRRSNRGRCWRTLRFPGRQDEPVTPR
ncbi:alpha/beta fold hydrolase [Streptomyces canus]|uniref:alpha/beta fold hydrolase n=1 Tax=Streptomyces canus TaxID=58343 RepID=UPI0036CD23E2